MAVGDFVQKGSWVGGLADYALMPAPVTLGNTLVRYACTRAQPGGPDEVGIDPDWIATPPGMFIQITDGAKTWYRAVKVTDTDQIDITPAGTDTDIIMEFEGALSLYQSDSAVRGAGSAVTCPPVAGVAGQLVVVLGFVNGNENTATGANYTPGAGWTELFDVSNGAGHPNSTCLYKRVASATGTYSPATTFAWTMGSGCAVESLAFVDAPPAAAPGTRIDWADDGFDIGSYDNVTGDVMSWTITRGAAAEITGGAQPGSATIVLRRTNRDGRYNPHNASGPLYGLLRDGARVHIAVNNDGTVSPTGTVRGLFAGRITDITQLKSEGPSPVPQTEIVCEDPLGWYQRTPVTIAESRTRSHGALRLAVLTAAGETSYDLAHEIGTMPLSDAQGNALQVLGQINAANGTRHFAKPSNDFFSWYKYTSRNRQYKLAGVADASLDAAADHVTETTGWRLGADTVINQQKATVEVIDFLDSSRIVWQHDAVPFTVGVRGPTSGMVIWATLPDYVDGQTLEYTYTGLNPTATFTSFGRTARIAFSRRASSSTVTMVRIRGYEAIRGDPQTYTADDEVSQALPRGIRAGSEISGEYVGVEAMATGIAEHMVWRYGNPQLRPTLTVHNWFPEQFELDLYDVIAVTASQFGASAVLFEIVGLTHVADVASTAAQHHTTTYVLQECRVQTATAWFTLDTSLLDGTDILAY